MSEWVKNETGLVPDGLTDADVLEVEYRNGHVITNDRWTDPDYWLKQGDKLDIVRWRKVEA